VTENSEQKKSRQPHPEMLLLAESDKEHYSFTKALTRNEEWARDILQEAYVLLNEALNDGREIKDPVSYFHTILRHLISRHRRRMKSAPIKADEEGLMQAAERIENVVPNEPEQRLDARQDYFTFFRGLRPKERIVFRLHWLKVFSLHDIAGITGLSIHTVRQYKTKLGKWYRDTWRNR
jgi:RNA polymerase sigma factor (sigma-70 family)